MHTSVNDFCFGVHRKFWVNKLFSGAQNSLENIISDILEFMNKIEYIKGPLQIFGRLCA